MHIEWRRSVKTEMVLIFTSKLNNKNKSFTISTINLSIHGNNNRFFDKLYEGSRAESSINVFKIT